MFENVLAAVIAGIILGLLSLIWKVVLILSSRGEIPWRSLGTFIWRMMLVIIIGLGFGAVYGYTYWHLINSVIAGKTFFIFWAMLGIISSLLLLAFHWKEAKTETTTALLQKWVHKIAENIKGIQPLVFTFKNIEMLCLYDQKANRMRVMSRVTDVKRLSQKKVVTLLDAHFKSVLDAHYAIHDNILMAVFLHPLKSLTEEDFVSALNQVANLVRTFDGKPSGGYLEFIGGSAVDMLDEPD